jgi:hypothetical protein
MENTLLQPLLQAGLLDIGDSDERLANIEKSIAEVQQKITKDHLLLERYTLTALDPAISADEATVIEVEDIIAVNWKALRAKFSERPVAIIRAVILNALYNAGSVDAYVARIIYLAASNFFPYAKLGREKEIIEKMIAELGNIAEAAAVIEWSLDETEPNLKLPVLKITGLQFGEITVDDAALRTNLTAAAKNDPNGHGPYHHPEQWSAHFSKYAGDGIVNVIQTTMSQLGASLSPSSIETPVNKFFTDFKKSLDQVLGGALKSLTAVERRSKLLWWKETLYSSSLKNSYRTLSPELQPMILAHDLYDQLPAIVPVSVDYLLRDTLLLLNKESDNKVTFADLFKVLLTATNKKFLKEYFTETNNSGRVDVTDFLSLAVHDKVEVSAFKERTGIDINAEVSLGQLSVIVMHDLFVHYLSSN